MPLNIYPCQGPHEEAVIIGDKASLAQLGASIMVALTNEVHGVEVFASDGEGYKVLIIQSDDTDLLPPYYEHTEKYGSGGKDPIQVMGLEIYRWLMETEE